MSEITIWSEASQTKIRAVQVTTPDADNENVIEFGPFFNLSSFCTQSEPNVSKE